MSREWRSPALRSGSSRRASWCHVARSRIPSPAPAALRPSSYARVSAASPPPETYSRSASAYSRANARSPVESLRSMGPLLHRDRRPRADRGHERELVHESPRAWQPEPEPARRRPAVLHRACDVADAWLLVAGDPHDPAPAALVGDADEDLPHPRVEDDVPGDLAHGRRDRRRPVFREAFAESKLPRAGPSHDDVRILAEGHPDEASLRGQVHPREPSPSVGPLAAPR